MPKTKRLTDDTKLVTAKDLRALEERFIRAMGLLYKLLKEEPKK